MTLHFLREMDRLNGRLIGIGSKIETQVSMAFHAIIKLDEAAARRVINKAAMIVCSIGTSIMFSGVTTNRKP